MARFNVGDLVKGVGFHYDYANANMAKGVVTYVYDNGNIKVKILEHSDPSRVGRTYIDLETDYFVPYGVTGAANTTTENGGSDMNNTGLRAFTGMVAKLRSGKYAMIIDTADCGPSVCEYGTPDGVGARSYRGDHYNADLTHKTKDKYDIMEVIKPTKYSLGGMLHESTEDLDRSNDEVVWVRETTPAPRTMTRAEIEAALGYAVNIAD